MGGKPSQGARRRTRVLAVVGLAYVLGAGLILLWPTSVTTGFRELLVRAADAFPYGDKLLELAANVLLFVPAGWLAAELLRGRWRLVVIPAGILVSGAIELTQALLLPGRVASYRDVLANSIGVVIGVLIGILAGRGASRQEAPESVQDLSTGDRDHAVASASHHGLRIAAWVASGIVAVGIIGGAWLALDTLRARDALTEVATATPRLLSALRADPASASAQLAGLQDAAGRAAAATSGVHWTAAGWLPWVGDNTRALQTVTGAIDALASEGLPGLADAAQTITPDRLAPRGGRIDTASLVEVRESVVAGDTAVATALASVAAINRSNLLSPVAKAVSRLEAALTDAHELTSVAAATVQLAPLLLGADGARSWLVLAQNNAELRSTGGIPGAVLLLSADDGALSIAEQRTSGDFGPYREPILPLTIPETTLFGPQLGLFVQDVNLTPDFPRTAELATAMWRQETGRDIQNVLSLDPLALANLLTATGPVEFKDPAGQRVRLSSDDAASFLMSGVYARYQRPAEQDAVFALAAQAIFKQLTSSKTDPAVLLQALNDSVAQGRLLLWSVDAAEQAMLEQLGATGTLRGAVETRDGLAPAVGVFLNQTTASKTGYYLDTTSQVIEETTGTGNSRQLTLRVSLTSTLKPGEAETLPEHVKWGNRDGKIRVNVLVYAPTDGTVTALSSEWAGFVTEHDDQQVSAQTVKIPAGETVELTWRITTGPGQTAPPVLRVTPGARIG